MVATATRAVPVRFVPVRNSGCSQADIDVIGPILYKLSIQLGGLDPTQLYDWILANPDHEWAKGLMQYLTQSMVDCTRLWRIHQLQEKIRAVAFVFLTAEGEELTIRALHYVTVRQLVEEDEDEEGPEDTEADPTVSRQPKYRPVGRYVALTEVAKSPDMEQQVLTQLEQELRSLKNRIKRYQLVFPGFRKRFKRVYRAIEALVS